MGPRIYSTKHMIEQSMVPDKEDSATVSIMKKAVFRNLSDRYAGEYNHLLECTAVDPRFRTLPHLEEDQRQDVFHKLKEKAVQRHDQTTFPVEETDEGGAGTSAPTPAAEQPADQADAAEAELQQPPPKKTALEHLLEGTFTEPAGVAQLNHMSGIEAEILRYRSETPISLTSCPHK